MRIPRRDTRLGKKLSQFTFPTNIWNEPLFFSIREACRNNQMGNQITHNLRRRVRSSRRMNDAGLLQTRAGHRSGNNNVIDDPAETLPLLYSLCKRWVWPAVEFRCQTNPDEADASVQDRKGDTVLHWVCFGNPPPEVVEALLQACPRLASTANIYGKLPIHGKSCHYTKPNFQTWLKYSFPFQLLRPIEHRQTSSGCWSRQILSQQEFVTMPVLTHFISSATMQGVPWGHFEQFSRTSTGSPQ